MSTSLPGLTQLWQRAWPPLVEIITHRTHRVQKPNYQFEKRRRDLEKKAKKEEKRLRKLEKSANPSSPEVTEPSPEGAADTTTV